jgi:hypothetical protein
VHVTGFSRKQVDEILDRDDNVCLMWGSNPFCAYYADFANHRINRGAGGSKAMNVTVNGCGICSRCNILIEDDSHLALVARVRGVKVRSSHNVARDVQVLMATPLLHPVIGPYFLDADGKRIREVEGG